MVGSEWSEINVELLKKFLENNIQESRAILEVKAGILTRQRRIEEDLLIANAELFLLVLDS